MNPAVPMGIPGSTGGGIQIPKNPLQEVIDRLEKLEALGATAGRAYRGVAQLCPTSVWTKIKLNTVAAGPNPGQFNLATGNYIVPATGIYLSAGCVAVETGAAEEGMVIASLWVNEGERLRGDRMAGVKGDAITNRVFCGLTFEEKGSKMELRVFHTFPTERPIELSPVQNCLSVIRIQ